MNEQPPQISSEIKKDPSLFDRANEKVTGAGRFVVKLLKENLLNHLSFVLGAFTVAIMLISSFTFFLYMYQPLFTPVQSIFLLNPNLNYELLNKASTELEEQNRLLEEKLGKTYPSPFRQPPS